MLRGVALFFAAFTLLNVVGDLRFARANGNLWWLDAWPLPLEIGRAFLVCVAVALLVFALAPAAAARFRRAGVGLVGSAAVCALVNVIRFYSALLRGQFTTPAVVPLSAVVLTALIAISWNYGRSSDAPSALVIACAAIAALLFPLAQVCFFGLTDYSRRADVAVVFGARALANGTPSDALADRVVTACDLYRRGYVKQLIFSGGPGEGRFTEPQVMSAYAQRLGVPASAIVEDPNGVTTEATVRDTVPTLRGARVLVVSHFYHLPRIKMTYQRFSIDVRTVPSRNTVPLSMPFNIGREDAAFWLYYLRRVA